MKTHELKTWPEPFTEVVEGRKKFELRRDDREFEVGDRLHLREWDPHAIHESSRGYTGQYTGREFHCEITYITRNEEWGVKPGFACLSIHPVD